MKKTVLFLLLLVTASSIFGQASSRSAGKIQVEFVKEKRNRVFARATILEPFPGWDSSWLRSFDTRLNQSMKLNRRLKKGKYLVTAIFITSKDGSFADIRSLTNVGYGTEAAVLSILMREVVRWLPATGDGRRVMPLRKSAVTNSDTTNDRNHSDKW